MILFAAVRNDADVFVHLSMANCNVSVYLDDTSPSDPLNLGVYDAGDIRMGIFQAPDGVEFTSLFNTTADAAVTFSSRGFSDIPGNICLGNGSDKYISAPVPFQHISTGTKDSKLRFKNSKYRRR